MYESHLKDYRKGKVQHIFIITTFAEGRAVGFCLKKNLNHHSTSLLKIPTYRRRIDRSRTLAEQNTIDKKKKDGHEPVMINFNETAKPRNIEPRNLNCIKFLIIFENLVLFPR